MGRLLALDYGAVRTGIAVTDPLQMIATSLETVPTKELDAWLKNYFLKEPVDAVVLGIPNNNYGHDNPVLKLVLAFREKFQSAYPQIPVHEMDERFTSSMAKQVILQSGLGKMDRRDKGRVDRISAVIILQSFMEKQNRL